MGLELEDQESYALLTGPGRRPPKKSFKKKKEEEKEEDEEEELFLKSSIKLTWKTWLFPG